MQVDQIIEGLRGLFVSPGGAIATEDPHAIPYAVVPEGHRLRSLEGLSLRPQRHRGRVSVEGVADFVAYFNRFAEEREDVAVFASTTGTSVTGVLDYHGPEPGYGDHEVVYTAPLSDEWKTWDAMNGRSMNQTDFARFIEDNLPDIASPPGAAILELTRKMESTRKVTFSSSVRSADGSMEIAYKDENESPGKMRLPEEMTLRIPVFRHGDPFEVVARLRHRVGEGKATFFYELYRPDKVKDEAFAAVVKQVGEGTGRPVLYGSASLPNLDPFGGGR